MKGQTINKFEYMLVFCEYNYNTGTAYFDDIQLIRTGIETGLSEEDFMGVYEDKLCKR